MSAYMIIGLDVRDTKRFRDFRTRVSALITKHSDGVWAKTADSPGRGAAGYACRV